MLQVELLTFYSSDVCILLYLTSIKGVLMVLFVWFGYILSKQRLVGYPIKIKIKVNIREIERVGGAVMNAFGSRKNPSRVTPGCDH